MRHLYGFVVAMSMGIEVIRATDLKPNSAKLRPANAP